ncbi:Putative transposase DNA-binding domain-containing protein [Desulfonatronum thiosulfatophilum]|uniref:Putative transposase DNA-binding domain-containing protein n=1 Tax=Desulfonatronum thiosulfatophilum TaxID=617002 RepID=A0A1G6C0E2_9BACT|nr:zinc ribbon domain-containing protein [Desulfonatronum thiosulfatophilum]SDB26288.1 Putative transposase DNA-binding domain-containing protein [Desulfonatronum thiosulfatophilum]
MPPRIYKYGLGKNIEGPDQRLPDQVFEQFRLQNRFWNALVEIEKAHAVKYDELRTGADARLGAVQERIDSMNESLEHINSDIKAQRKNARKVVPTDPATKKQIADIKGQIKALKIERKELRERIKGIIRPQAEALNTQRLQEINDKRREFAALGLYWCNYNAVLNSMETARKHILRKRAQGLPADFTFRPFTGQGRLTVQLMHGPPFSEILEGINTQLQLGPVPDDTWTSPDRAERRRLSRTQGRIRIGSEGFQGREPIWFEFPIVLHRPVPEEGKIKKAQVSRRKVGLDWVWELDLTVVLPEVQPEAQREPQTGAQPGQVRKVQHCIGLDLGWRKTDDGLRVAAWVDSDGQQGVFRLDVGYVATQDRLDGLKSVLDKNRDQITAQLLDWGKQHEHLPHWLDLQKVSVVKSHQYFLHLADTWANDRQEADQEVFEDLAQWRKRFVHLYSWHSNLSRKMRYRRREAFRLFAKKLAETYTHVFLEEFNLAWSSRKKDAEDTPLALQRASNKWARVASPGAFRQELQNFCNKTGSLLIFGKSDKASRTCPECKNKIAKDMSARIMVICEACRAEYDQDLGAAANVLCKGMENHFGKQPEDLAG